MTDSPRVTIGFTTFNVERYLRGALDAVLAQDFTDYEVVMCDNQSTDSTWDICREYASRDPRFRVFRNPTNVGLAGNIRRVMSLARGEYFRLTAHDDLMAPTVLRRCVEVLDANPRAVLAYPMTTVIDENGTRVYDWNGDPDIRGANAALRVAAYVRGWSMINELFGVIRTKDLRAVSPFGQYVSADKQFMVELAARGEFHLIPERLFYRRFHQFNTFGERSTSREVYAWMEPELVDRVPRRYGRPGGDHSRLTVRTTRALLAAPMPAGRRAAVVASFATTWQMKRAHITLGRWKRRLLRMPPAPRPVAEPSPMGEPSPISDPS
jgi:glycosyltransferase involved in cell wall biosynthesis